jgi:Tryptophan-associated transmembrane protein (Trp_oprn_chp)
MTEPAATGPITEPGSAGPLGDDAAIRRTARRGLTTAVLACVVGAGIALFAATRTWSTTTQRQAPPLPDRLVHHTGGSLIGWLPALALVGLAGAGALLATRGIGRTIIGLLLVILGLGLVGGAIDGLDIAAGVWPVFVGLGGLGIAWSGLAALRSGATWPAMGARYERSATPARSTDERADASAAAPSESGVTAGRRPRTHASMWDDLDRGVDPTDREA